MRRAKSLPLLSAGSEHERVVVSLNSTRRSLNSLCIDRSSPMNTLASIEVIFSSLIETAGCANCGRKIIFQVRPGLEMNSERFCSLDCYSTKMLQEED
ncbi:hypothetical protein GAYE_SCF02G2127 [Galdieria yellowstonensis]|uniref:FLZ-type domain-containing protein n=1 Tax=Galdieria yellowstonensis TaxID=3028027 RepID=A0AAV9IA32_9RHOD|nr:hypothetical protein GAYE_SCF02G2127 [Galdieria yellowstonensis]